MRRIISLIIFVGIIIITYQYDIHKTQEFTEINYKSEIIGIIDSVYYDIKEIPTIKVNNVEYYLHLYSIRKQDNIRELDSIYKRKNSNELYYYRKTSNGYRLESVY